MTDLDAIRARHVPQDTLHRRCDACDQPWGEAGCDTAIVIAALDAMTAARDSAGQAWLDADAATKRIKDYHNEIMKQHAEREQRLRAALPDYIATAIASLKDAGGVTWNEARAMGEKCTALATTPEGES